MCHLLTQKNSTWGSTIEGKGGPSLVNKKISQKEFLPVELSGGLAQKKNISEYGLDSLDGGGRPVSVFLNNLVARHKPLEHLRPDTSRSGSPCAKTRNLLLKVPPNPLQRGVTERSFLVNVLFLGRSIQSSLFFKKLVL
jgi:hypothetical protein